MPTNSVWRPLNIVKNAPLVNADRRTVLQSDLMEVEKVLIDKVERNYYVKNKPYHEYYYMSDQSPDHVTIFTTCDQMKGEYTAGRFLESSAVVTVTTLINATLSSRHRAGDLSTWRRIAVCP